MSVHMEREVKKLRKMILSLGALVEENLSRAVRSLELRDTVLAEKSAAADAQIDQCEIEIEEECLKVLALHQPVATDLRFLIAVLKINDTLERIGDQAVNIANKTERITAHPQPVQVDVHFNQMANAARSMLKDALDALVNMDAEVARHVCCCDDEVDKMKREARQKIEAAIQETPSQVSPLLALLGATRNIERIADLATNIAEDVVYLVDGRIIRHGEED